MTGDRAVAALAATAAALAAAAAIHDFLAGQLVSGALLALAMIAAAIAWSRFARTMRLPDGNLGRIAEGEVGADDEDRRLQLLGSLAAGIGHELGQPLSAARVGIEGLHYLRQLGREPSPEHVSRTLSQVGMSIIAMTQTIEHLRALAGAAGPAVLHTIDLGACVESVLADRDHWLRYQDIRIDCPHSDQRIQALAEPAGLRLILVNLLRNAAEAVASQGLDRRTLRVVIAQGPSIEVHDTGAGISASNLSRLFDPFFTTKAGHARGIGLSLAKASAERMGAELSVVSAVGSGTVFTLRLKAPPA